MFGRIHFNGSSVEAAADPQRDLVATFTHDRFVEMFLSQSSRSQLGLFVAASVVAVVWYERLRTPAPLMWLACLALVSALRHRHTAAFVRQAAAGSATARIAALLVVNGCMMAVPLTAFGYMSEIERAAVSIVLLGAATASIATTSGYRLIFLAFAAPMLVPLAIVWAWVQPQGDLGLVGRIGVALLVLAFQLFLVSIARQAHRAFEESSRFRYGQQQLNRELTAALEAASDANRAKTQFLAAASHDLRQPIHSINVLIAALSLRKLDAKSGAIVTLLETVTRTLSQQLDSLLDISKLDAGTIKPAWSELRLDALVRSHHAALEPVAAQRGVALTLGVVDEVWVRTDAALVTRVLANLTDNALKFTPRGGTIRLALMGDAAAATLTVTDSGIGIAASEHEQVFREFYQVGNQERDRSMGLGLGLSIVRRLCRLLHIEVELRSGLGQGTEVTLRLQRRSTSSSSAPAGGYEELASPRGLKVLVIDDESMARESMRMLLEEMGCLVRLASGTDEALALAELDAFDVVLSDYRLRGTDSGLVALQELRRHHPGIRAVLVTGDTAPDRLRDAQAAAVPLLHKPLTLPQLLAVLQPASRGPAEHKKGETTG